MLRGVPAPSADAAPPFKAGGLRVTKPGVAPASADTTITYEGQVLGARAGESIAAALVAAGRLMCRTTRKGGRRGVFCGMGICSECAVTINGQGGRLACMETVVPGLEVAMDPPVRALAAEVPDTSDPPEEELAAELVVIGAGPAGMAAALEAAEAGADVILVDNRHGLGGQYFKQPAKNFSLNETALDTQYRAGRELIARVASSSVRTLHDTRVWASSGPEQLYAVSPTHRYMLSAHAVVLATGAFERGVPFPGWTLPGVMTTGAAQTLLRSYLVTAGQRVLVSGNGPLNLQVAAELHTAGINVVAVAETAPLFRPAAALHLAGLAVSSARHAVQGLGYLLKLARVPLLARTSVVAVGGRERVEWAEVARLDTHGHPIDSTRRRLVVDAVCLGYGFVPSTELARMLGCEEAPDPKSGVITVVRDSRGRTSLERVWSPGDGGRIGGAQVAQAMGARAGLDAARALGHVGPTSTARERHLDRVITRHERFQRSLWRLFEGPRLVHQLADPDTIVCRCEEVTMGELHAAATPWSAGAGALKRLTRAGMGKCQGRYCGPIVAEIARLASDEPVGPRSGFAPQAPCLPTPLFAIASRLGMPSHAIPEESETTGVALSPPAP